MDTYRGRIGEHDSDDDSFEHGPVEYGVDDTPREPPPPQIGQDERRMQVRAYNFWASLLDNRNFPSVEDLDPASLPDFGPHSVLLDFTAGIENPAIQFLGAKLAEECGADHAIATLADVPSRSLLSRITDHYMQIIANQAPIGFEAEFVNQREKTILYRGILLPFSSDDDSIDFIYGVINWKELADQRETDELLLEIDHALQQQATPETRPARLPLANWADGPVDPASGSGEREGPDEPLDLGAFGEAEGSGGLVLPAPAFGALDDDGLVAPDESAMALADWLASARELAEAAHGSEDRTRQALYAAIGRAWDFALAAEHEPEEFAELVADAGLTVQDRAPLTPVVKLVFGADYDKTRLTEYASALAHAQRLGLPRGTLAGFLASAPGGLKGVVAEERRLKRADAGRDDTAPRTTPRDALARRLRKLAHRPLGEVSPDGAEFTLLVARRLGDGEVVLLGEVANDPVLLQRAARGL